MISENKLKYRVKNVLIHYCFDFYVYMNTIPLLLLYSLSLFLYYYIIYPLLLYYYYIYFIIPFPLVHYSFF